jgi:hypothetical protein
MTLEDVPDKRSGLMSEFALGCDSCNESSSFTTIIEYSLVANLAIGPEPP